MEGAGGSRPRVVVLGGGFAGVGAAHSLADADVDIVLVDKHDYHTFQPLLYQLATGLLETSAVGHSLRDLIHREDNAAVHKTTVTAIDLEAREVQLTEMEPLTYDYLMLALGAEQITDAREKQVLPQLGSVALQSGEHAGETIARVVAGRRPSRSSTATRGRWRRSAAGRQSCRCSAERP
jgi:NADPH-dependent 2,4-dienoyl-CoA reductase/sulfur reductase-like enzyme